MFYISGKNIEEVRAHLQYGIHVELKEGERLRRGMAELAKKKYRPKHKNMYLQFMNNYELNFQRLHGQSSTPYVWEMCILETGDTYPGDCVEECLDVAISEILGDRYDLGNLGE